LPIDNKKVCCSQRATTLNSHDTHIFRPWRERDINIGHESYVSLPKMP
jgi:hypothetical protein